MFKKLKQVSTKRLKFLAAFCVLGIVVSVLDFAYSVVLLGFFLGTDIEVWDLILTLFSMAIACYFLSVLLRLLRQRRTG